MIESIITDYLQNNRRLVIPGLGAFLRKEGGELVFVPFLNKDDGVLTGLVRKTYGSSSAEAQTVIEQYVETIRKTLDEQGRYVIVPLGSLQRDPNGIVYLNVTDLSPVAEKPHKPAIQERETIVEEKVVVVTPEKAEVAVEETRVEKVAESSPKTPFSEGVTPPVTLYDRLMEQQQKQEAARQVPAAEKPQERQTARAATISDSAHGARTNAPESIMAPPKPAEPKKSVYTAPESASGTKKAKRADLILVFAIVVAVLAVAAMVYAYFSVELPPLNLN